MDGKLLAQLACVAWADADAAIPDPYAWPPAPAPSAEQLREHRRLRTLAQQLFHRARLAGCFESGLDALFGEEGRNPGSAAAE